MHCARVGGLDFDMTGEFINLGAIIIAYSARINPLMQTFVVYLHRVLSPRGGVFGFGCYGTYCHGGSSPTEPTSMIGNCYAMMFHIMCISI